MTSTRTGIHVRREVWQLRRVGDAPPTRHRWGCWIESGPDEQTVRIGATDDLSAPEGPDLAEPAARLHETLLLQVPGILRRAARTEVGIVVTRTWEGDRQVGQGQREYALATAKDVVITLVGELSPVLTVPWRGTCLLADLDPRLPVLLGPSAVLSLAAGVVELPADPSSVGPPGWLSVDPLLCSPYPPHDYPAARVEHLMRPMWTTRASRGEHHVRAALPAMPVGPPALWVESLVSMDTLGRCWQASISLERDGARWWLPRPLSVDIGANELLGRAVGQVEPPRPTLDRDPVDGESFGIAPGLRTSLTAGELAIGRGQGG